MADDRRPVSTTARTRLEPRRRRPLRDGACSLARREQLEQENPGLRIYLQGFWLAEVPPQLLRRETRVSVLYRWRLGDLLDDVSHLLRTKGTAAG